MILITSAKYVNAEMQAEFGRIPPSFLPLGGKRLYEYQIKLFKGSKQKIILTLPEGFIVSDSDQNKLDNLKVHILYIPENLSLGESVVYALNMNLPLNKELQILHGDTYFSHIKKQNNSFSVTKVETNYDWTFLTLEKDVQFGITNLESVDNLSSFVISGYFNIENPYDFIHAVVKSKYSFVNGLKSYSKQFPFEIMDNNTWLDFGLVSNYFHSKKTITTERSFNSLRIKDGYVEKSSNLKGKLEGEINWYENFPNSLNLHIPRYSIFSDRLSYKTEYLYNNTIAELFVFGKLPLHVWKRVFLSLKNFLENLHSYTSTDSNINFDYHLKTIERIKVFSSENYIDLNRSWFYNGKKMPSIYEIIETISLKIKQSDVSCFIHGDFCFSNIVYDFRSSEIKTFDPRGLDFNGKITPYGEKYYDYAKLFHSVIGLYDFIIAGFFTCKIDDYSIRFLLDINDEIKEIQKLFFEIFEFESEEKLYIITIHLFLSMLPLHNDNKEKQNALLSNVFRLYHIWERKYK